jgi:hypothetical protein
MCFAGPQGWHYSWVLAISTTTIGIWISRNSYSISRELVICEGRSHHSPCKISFLLLLHGVLQISEALLIVEVCSYNCLLNELILYLIVRIYFWGLFLLVAGFCNGLVYSCTFAHVIVKYNWFNLSDVCKNMCSNIAFMSSSLTRQGAKVDR